MNKSPGTELPREYGISCFSLIMMAVFGLGLFLTFSKTADLMAGFAPQSFLGYTGIESIYGVCAALLVDGTIALMKLKSLFGGRARNAIEWVWDMILTVFPFLISGFAQVFDSFMVRQTLSSQPPEIQLIANWGIPLIPIAIVGGFLVYGFIQSAPAGMFSEFSGAVSQAVVKFRMPAIVNPFKKRPLADTGRMPERKELAGKPMDPTQASTKPSRSMPES